MNTDTTQEKGSLLLVIVFIGALVIVGFGGYTLGKRQSENTPSYANQQTTTPNTNVVYLDIGITPETDSYSTPTSTSLNSTQVFDEVLFSITTPMGWKRKSKELLQGLQGPIDSIEYIDEKGNFFTVEIDPGGRGVAADKIWNLQATPLGDGIAITKENDFCVKGNVYCTVGDGRLNIFGRTVTVKNHNYVFFMGNDREETIENDLLFRSILTSFKAK